MSGNVGSDISESGMVANVGAAVGIASPSVSVYKLFSTSGFHFRFHNQHLSFRCRPMSGRVGSAISKLGMVANVGVAVEIASPSVSVQKLFPLPVCGRHFEFRMSADIWHCQQCHI